MTIPQTGITVPTLWHSHTPAASVATWISASLSPFLHHCIQPDNHYAGHYREHDIKISENNCVGYGEGGDVGDDGCDDDWDNDCDGEESDGDVESEDHEGEFFHLLINVDPEEQSVASYDRWDTHNQVYVWPAAFGTSSAKGSFKELRNARVWASSRTTVVPGSVVAPVMIYFAGKGSCV